MKRLLIIPAMFLVFGAASCSESVSSESPDSGVIFVGDNRTEAEQSVALVKAVGDLVNSGESDPDKLVEEMAFARLALEHYRVDGTLDYVVEVTGDAFEESNVYLRNKIRHCLYEIRPDRTAQEKLDNDIRLTRQAGKTKEVLTAVQITTPNGERYISEDEAMEIIRFVAVSVGEICRKTK